MNLKHFIKFIIDASPLQFKAVIRTLSKDQALAIREIIVNLLQGNINLPEKSKQSLKKYRTYLRLIAQNGNLSIPSLLYKVITLLRPFLKEI